MSDSHGAPRDAEERITLSAAEFATIRQGVGFTALELADRLGVSRQAVHHWEVGKRQVPRGVAEEMEALEALFVDHCEAALEGVRSDRDGHMTIPRGIAGGFPAGWWKAVAFQVSLRLPAVGIDWGD